MNNSIWKIPSISHELTVKIITELWDPYIQRILYDVFLSKNSYLVNHPEIIAIRRNHPDYIKAREQSKEDRRQTEQHKAREKQLMSFLALTPVIPWHTLDMQVQWESIYNHLVIYQENFAKKFAELPDFTDKMKLFDTRIARINMDTRLDITQLDVKDRFVMNDAIWVPNVTYVRDSHTAKWYKCSAQREQEIRALIADLSEEFTLTEAQAIQLFVLRKWLGKSGRQDYEGNFDGVGSYGEFAIGPVTDDGSVPYLYFTNSSAWFGSGSVKSAIAQLSD